MENSAVTFEKSFNASPEKIWKALTVDSEMKKWYFDIPGFKAEKGFEFEFYGGPPEKQYRHLCKITEVIPNRKLSHSWKYDGYEGNSQVTFDLIPEGNKTRVKVTHEGLETFPPNPDFAKKNFNEGWTHIIGTSLEEYLEKN
jgi:uncharacterized protein YndB with AHSA1/START domain